MPARAAFDLVRMGAGLPFAAAVPRLREALGSGAVVVEAPPGTGKTTLVPPAVANKVRGRVVVVQPRRVAADAAARRLATLAGSRLGELVGLTVRGRRVVGPRTRIEVVTPGVLLRRLVADPELAGVSAVVLDEVHERGLEIDLLVGMLAEVRALREDLTLVAMSATLDAGAFADLLGATVVAAQAPSHPLTIEWAPPQGAFADARGVSREFLAHVAHATARAWTALDGPASEGDALVFLPGVAEVTRVIEQLESLLPASEVEILALHGRLPLAEQQRVTGGRGPGDRRRIVVSTALAESSLTVPGVRLVVDAGLSREPRRDAARGMSGLVTVRASRDAAVQRAGRAARQGAGVAVRCYDEATFAALPAHVTPQVQVADLTGAALLLAAWGTPGGVGLPLPTPLPETALADAVGALADLGLLDDDGHITPLGRRVVTIPADPRLARALLAEGVSGPGAADVVAMLSDDLRPEGASLPALLAALRSGRHPGSGRWRTEAARLRRIAGESQGTGQESAPGSERGPDDGSGRGPDDGSGPGPDDRSDQGSDQRPARGTDEGREVAIGRVVATARPGWVARRLPGEDVYVLASGTRAVLPPGSALAGSPWLAVADVERASGRAGGGTGAVIRAAAPVSEEDALQAAVHLLVEQESCVLEDGRAVCRRVRRLGGIELTSTPVQATPAALARMWEAEFDARGLRSLRISETADRLRRRLAFLHHHIGPPWPDVSDAALLARREEWFRPVARVEDVDLVGALRSMLPWPEAARLDELAPERLTAGDGSTARVDYPEGSDAEARPVVAVRLQSMFGVEETPRLADGRVPVLFHLLSPARRPLAITDDLASFWAGPYAAVRSEMRGRYPKHPWPERPS